MQVLLPGDLLPTVSTSTANLHLGPGLASTASRSSASAAPTASSADAPPATVRATRAGLLGSMPTKDSHRFWLESTLRRYTPSPPEPVLGIITARHAEGYRVDIGSAQPASLDGLAFEGATKRNKPNLKIGTLVYGYLLPTPPFAEPELSCVDQTTQKSAGFGELLDGYLIRNVELNRCRALLSPKNPLLSKLGSKFPFEVAVGMNGRIWVKASSTSTTTPGGGGEDAETEELEKMCQIIQELKG
ncbi:exosome non-catalytic core subunit RRP40 [Sporobolomyces koalae]|uniref:exosome non-catalytic core subunit RRP40 n=1 Tax=Sporobolomyces koalae TaxID=500713 RepID=UPI00317DF830